MLRAWLDSWRGIRWTAVAMRAEHQVLRLARSSDGWMATFTYVGPTQLPQGRNIGTRDRCDTGAAFQFAAWHVIPRHIFS